MEPYFVVVNSRTCVVFTLRHVCEQRTSPFRLTTTLTDVSKQLDEIQRVGETLAVVKLLGDGLHQTSNPAPPNLSASAFVTPKSGGFEEWLMNTVPGFMLTSVGGVPILLQVLLSFSHQRT